MPCDAVLAARYKVDAGDFAEVMDADRVSAVVKALLQGRGEVTADTPYGGRLFDGRLQLGGDAYRITVRDTGEVEVTTQYGSRQVANELADEIGATLERAAGFARQDRTVNALKEAGLLVNARREKSGRVKMKVRA